MLGLKVNRRNVRTREKRKHKDRERERERSLTRNNQKLSAELVSQQILIKYLVLAPSWADSVLVAL